MTLRDLTPEETKFFQVNAQRRIDEIKKSNDKLNVADYSLGFSDGMKAVLAHISHLP